MTGSDEAALRAYVTAHPHRREDSGNTDKCRGDRPYPCHPAMMAPACHRARPGVQEAVILA